MLDQIETSYKLPQLTARETEVLKLFADGYTQEEIAHHLKISQRTIAAHKDRIMLKLKIRTVAGLVKHAVLEGITTLHDHRGNHLYSGLNFHES